MFHQNCCYYDTIENFLNEKSSDWLQVMQDSFEQNFPGLPLGDSQITAWKDCFRVLQRELPSVSNEYPGFSIIFEYALPFESGRRPDVILLCQEHVIVMEFKQYNTAYQAHIDQVAAYARDLREYHLESRDKDITPVLIDTRASNCLEEVEGVFIGGKGDIYSIIDDIVAGSQVSPTDPVQWMESLYEPLPTILEAAKKIFDHEELPNIRRVNSTCIPQALELLKQTAAEAQNDKKHVLALVTGVPGAGKTYLGLQYVYDICDDRANSWFLSGNNALIAVLQDALHSTVFVRNVHTVINEYTSHKRTKYTRNVIVFDEGQRAWDSNQMESKRKADKSEPDILMELCDKELDWCVLLILVGEGQEIYKGEHGGLSQWNEALKGTSNTWEVICPQKLENLFDEDIHIIPDDSLNLDVSLRTHVAGDVGKFVNDLMEGNINDAREIVPSLLDGGFSMYFTNDLERAKEYCRMRYEGEQNKRYGCIASSKAKSLENYGMKPNYYGFKTPVAKWYNAPVTDPDSSCALERTLSEFDCQGLEIDMPIIGWADDVIWNFNKGVWQVNRAKTQDDIEDRINSYRVLLTRGRDGFILFIPEELEPMTDLFRDLGIPELPVYEKAEYEYIEPTNDLEDLGIVAEDGVKEFFENAGLKVIDKREKGGCLWVIGDEDSIGEYVSEAVEKYDISGNYGKGKATNYQVGWYTKTEK